MERNLQKNGVINGLLLLLVGVATFAIARYSHSLAGQFAAVILLLGVLVALVSWFQMRLEERERNERLEFDELTKGVSTRSALFSTDGAETFPARSAREQFEKYFVPGFTILLLVLEGAGAVW